MPDQFTPDAAPTVSFTPGPWTYEETTLSICRLIISVEDVQAFEVSAKATGNRTIAYVPCDVNREEQEANARLLAASPDLYAALRGLIAPDGNSVYATAAVIRAGRDAIAKAEARR
jgi:hypothetical protein